VIDFCLQNGLSEIDGVVYLDETDRKMILLRQSMKSVELSACGIPPSRYQDSYSKH
jgi:hypothetical protein